MSLRDHLVPRDNFILTASVNGGFGFPCCACENRFLDPDEEECLRCDHNANAVTLETARTEEANGPEGGSRMHYANGTEAKVGDRIVGKDASGVPIGGIVVTTMEGSDRCNLDVVLSGAPIHTVTASECILASDVASSE